MSNQSGEETKQCPRCGKKVLNRRAKCQKCGYRFPMSCEGCGRETVGRVFCPECAESGVYHFQRSQLLQPIRPEEKSVRKFVSGLLNGPGNEEIEVD